MSMPLLARAFLAWILAAAAVAAHAAAADPGVSTVVTPVPGQVTLGRAAGKNQTELVTYAAYQVTVSNSTTNTLNRVFVAASASATPSVAGDPPIPVIFYSSIPSTLACTGLGTSSVNCALASLPPGASTSLYLVAKAPQQGTAITVAWTAGGDEGNGGGNGCCNQTGTAVTALIDPTTNTSFLTNALSFVPPEGTTLFTGVEAVPSSTDGWTTLVRVPQLDTSLPWTTASIAETTLLNSCAPYAKANGCFSSDLTIPGSFAKLLITLRWDKDFFALGNTKPADVKLFYTGDSSLHPAIAYPIQLQLCSADLVTWGSAPSSGRPCLTRPPFKLSNQTTPNKDLWGDLQFDVEALDNGKYTN